MNDDSNVVFLAFRNDTPTDDSVEVLSCRTCHNKTWKAVYRRTSLFPVLSCACCGYEAGHFGWAPAPDDE